MKMKPQYSTRLAAAKSNLLTLKIERGFSLIELMIASAIALIILVAVSNIFISSSSSERSNSSASELTTNGRYAMETIRHDLLQAGFKGIGSQNSSILTTTIPAVTGDCATGFATNTATNPLTNKEYELGNLFGTNDSNAGLTGCIPNASYSTGDILVARHAAQAPKATAANTISMHASYGRWELFKGTVVPLGFKGPVLDYPLETSVYYISPNTSGADGIPALNKVSLGAGPAMTSSLVASNIQDMQFQYGITDKENKTTRFYDANDISNTATPSEWGKVSAVRVWILVRGTRVEPSYTNTNSYVMGSKTVTASDGFRRELYSTTVSIRNF